jgi:hypothetical protein
MVQEKKQSVLLDIWVEIEENIFPMLLSGASLDDIMTRINGLLNYKMKWLFCIINK